MHETDRRGDSTKHVHPTQGHANVDAAQLVLRALIYAVVGGALGWFMASSPGAALGAVLGWLLVPRLFGVVTHLLGAVAGAAFGLFFLNAERSGATAGVAAGVMIACKIDVSSFKGRLIVLAVIVIVTILGYPTLREYVPGLSNHHVSK